MKTKEQVTSPAVGALARSRNPKELPTDELIKAATPVPWVYRLGRGANPRFHIQASGGYQIASTPQISSNRIEAEGQEASAELICRAVNSFEAMRNFVREVDEIIRMGKPSDVLWNHCVEKREAVLALAEGKAVQQ